MPKALLAHPFPDLYGSDRCLLDSIDGLVDAGWTVCVALPEHGRLEAELAKRSVTVVVQGFPVLRKALMSIPGIIKLLLNSPLATARLVKQVRAFQPDVLLVNTLTLPHWLLAGRLARVKVVCHVHELQSTGPRLISKALVLPLLLANVLITNSAATTNFIAELAPRLRRRARLVYNGFDVETAVPTVLNPAPPHRLVLVGRLSLNKGQDIALEALSRVKAAGHDATLELVGDVFRGYEHFQDALKVRAAEADLKGSVSFTGFLQHPEEALRRAHIALVPSRNEPFGNVAVEAQLARRPVIVSRIGGLPEIVTDGVTGLVVPPEDPGALATAIINLIEQPETASRLAASGYTSAVERFSRTRYKLQIVETLTTASRR